VISGAEARRLVLVAAAYAALTFAMAYPLSASPGTAVVADAPDTHVYIWTIAWDVHAFVHRPLRIFEANIYHPFAHTLAFSENLIGSALFAAPFIWLTGNMVLGMNMAALITCLLCGVGGYVLGRALHLRPSAAFLCGLVYAFAPPRFFRLGQLHMTAVQWIPFTLAFLHMYFERGTRKYLLLAVACFTLQVLSSGHGAAFTAVAVALLIGWRVVFGQPLAVFQWLRDFGATGAYLLAPALVMFLPYRLVQQGGGLRYAYNTDYLPSTSSFVASPSNLHVYLQREWLAHPGVNEAADAYLFPGILVLVTALVAVLTWRPRSLAGWRNDAVGFYALLGAGSALMFAPPPLGLWQFVHWLPGFNFIRMPSRFITIVVLCLGVLLAAAIDRLTGRLSPALRAVAVVAVAFGLLAEYVSYPFPAVPYSVPVPAVDRWLDTRPKPFVVAELPVPSPGNWGAHERMQVESMLHATAHWQKTIHGYSSLRRPLHSRVYLELTAFPDERSISSLRELGVNYVIVHTDKYPEDRWREVESQLARFPELQLIHRDGPGRVYTFRRAEGAASPPEAGPGNTTLSDVSAATRP
jgi:hypothetical protein